MHETERFDVTNTLADRVSDGDTDADADELTDPVTGTHTAADGRAAERVIRHRRLGVRRWNASLPIIRPR